MLSIETFQNLQRQMEMKDEFSRINVFIDKFVKCESKGKFDSCLECLCDGGL